VKLKLSVLKQIPILIALGIIGAVCAVQLLQNDFPERLERMTYDWRVREAVRFAPDVSTNLGFVRISDNTISTVGDGSLGFKYGLYWPRQIYGRVVRELHAEGASLVAFDILFNGLRPDHDNPKMLMPDGTEIGSDEYFARQLHNAGNVLLASSKGILPDELFQTNALGMGDISEDRDSDGILRRALVFRSYLKWHPVFLQLQKDPEWGVDLASAVVSSNSLVFPRTYPNPPITLKLDKDGNFDMADVVGDNIPPGMKRYDKPFTEERVWHVGIVMAARQLGLDLDHPEINLDRGWVKLKGSGGLSRTIPVDKNGYFYVNWCLPQSDSRLVQEPFEVLLALDQERHGHKTKLGDLWAGNHSANWKDKLIMIGSVATGNDLTDRGATPLEEDTILVSVHWNVANSVLTGHFVRRSGQAVNIALIIALGGLAAILSWKLRDRSNFASSIWVVIIFALYLAASFIIYVRYLYWIPMFMPLVGGLLTTHFAMLGYLVFFEQRERKRIRSVFAKVVAPDVVAELLKTEELSFDGTRQVVTVFFSDIRGFTAFTDASHEKAAEYIRSNNLEGDEAEEVHEQMTREILSTVNTYLKLITDTVVKNGGTVDKLIGDCVMAYWGAPLPNPQHAVQCVRTAIQVQRSIRILNLVREDENARSQKENSQSPARARRLLTQQPILVVGTGINTGDVSAGLMGSDESSSYTVFGREVNLASRLESVSGRSRICISQSTLEELKRHDPALAATCKPLPPEHLKGFRDPVPVFEVPWQE
jgi:class 3 adenylate cyclase/CHASE2 domain-containing sensor protein